MKTSAAKLYALILLVIALWAGNYVVAKVALREIPPVLLMSLRMGMAGLIMLPFLWRELATRKARVTPREAGLWSLLGIGGIMLNQFFFVLGLSMTTVTHSAMIAATTPVWVLLIAALLGMEVITLPKIAGMGLAVAGIAVLQVFRPKPSLHGPTVIGDLVMLLASLLFSLMTVFGKRLNTGGNAIILNSVGYIGGAVVLAPLGWWASRSFDFRSVSSAGWLGLIYMAALSSVFCYVLYYWVLARLPASRVATFQYLQPLLATLMAVSILGEEMTAPAIASGGVIIAGVFLTERFG